VLEEKHLLFNFWTLFWIKKNYIVDKIVKKWKFYKLTVVKKDNENLNTICFINLYNKRVRPIKNEPQQGISYLERLREGGEREGRVGGQVSTESYLRLG
jgi:hypothetical protein